MESKKAESGNWYFCVFNNLFQEKYKSHKISIAPYYSRTEELSYSSQKNFKKDQNVKV